jgi:hypothetical protein
MMADEKFNAAARAREIENLNEMRKELKASDPDAVPAFDRELKAKGLMVTKKPVKKMMGGGKMNVDGYYGKGGKMPNYSKGGMMKYLKGGQVKLDANKDGKISSVDFKMLKKK